MFTCLSHLSAPASTVACDVQNGISDEASHSSALKILLQMGEFFQIQVTHTTVLSAFSIALDFFLPSFAMLDITWWVLSYFDLVSPASLAATVSLLQDLGHATRPKSRTSMSYENALWMKG